MAAHGIPLNLPHAGTIAARIEYHVRRRMKVLGPEQRGLLKIVDQLLEKLGPIRAQDENPREQEARRVADEAAAVARQIVDGIEAQKLGDDRLGQAIRNLFECLELGEEGAQLSLRAGENPDSALR